MSMCSSCRWRFAAGEHLMGRTHTVGERTPSSDILNVIEQMDGLMALGETLVKSGMLPQSIRTREAAVAIILKGRELGIGALEAFSSLHIIKGRPTISPQLMMALADRSGQLDDCQVVDDGHTCSVTVKRKGRTDYTATFSMDDAQNMGLLNRPNWKAMPQVMRQWRATSAAFRQTFADILAGLSTPDEVGASVDAEGTVVFEECDSTGTKSAAEMAQPRAMWAATEEGLGFRPFFDRAREILGPDTYTGVLSAHGCKHYIKIETREQAMVIVKTFRAQGVSLKRVHGSETQIPEPTSSDAKVDETGLSLPQDLIDQFISRPE